MSESAQPNKASNLSKPAQELLEQYKNYREDGIVEIKEPIPSDNNEQSQTQSNNKTKDITTKIKQKTKLKKKRSTIIKPLNSKQSIGGYDDSWWDNLIKAENKTENDVKHKLNNISLMQKYETEKDPSPFNKDNHMEVNKNWETFLNQETEKDAEKYFKKLDKNDEKKDNKNTITKNKKKSKKKVRFADNLITKQGSSENVMSENPNKNIKKSNKKLKQKLPSKKQYGNLVGFFNKKPAKTKTKTKTKTKNTTENNPYLDQELMQGFGDFTPNKNQTFENKFDAKNQPPTPTQPTIIESNEFKSMIIPSNEFKTNANKKLPNKKKVLKKPEKIPAFNGHVFERKPPDMVYITDKTTKKQSEINPQILPKISHAQNKQSLFRKRVAMNDEYLDLENDHEIEPKTDSNKRVQKKVTFSDSLVTKELLINDADIVREKENVCVLFLDVDGVLNCTYSPCLSRAHILRLKTILNRVPKCKICVSSSWRVYKQTRMKLLNGLQQFGGIDVKNVIIGYTPKIQKDAFKYRAEEIEMYLQYDEFLHNNYNVLRWCAIDDIPLDIINKQYTQFMKGHFVKTNPAKGLTDYDVEKVCCILNNIDAKSMNKRLEMVCENINREEKMQLEIVNVANEQIKILFLDVDGVLNYKGFDDGGVNGALCKKCLVRLKKVIDATGCKLVLSTSWRRMPCAKEQLLRQLSDVVGINVNECVIGDTPVLGSEIKKSIEIYKYLEDVENKYDVVSWIAIDDMDLDKIGTNKTKQMFKNHFVKTDIQVGLSDKNVENAISILNK